MSYAGGINEPALKLLSLEQPG